MIYKQKIDLYLYARIGKLTDFFFFFLIIFHSFLFRLAVDKNDGAINRRIQVCGDKQLKDLKYLLKRETKDKFSDEHLWFSIIARPTLSTFTRIDRLTCGFVLLYMTMLTNILYYEVDTSKKTDGLTIGPFSLTPQQVNSFYS